MAAIEQLLKDIEELDQAIALHAKHNQRSHGNRSGKGGKIKKKRLGRSLASRRIFGEKAKQGSQKKKPTFSK